MNKNQIITILDNKFAQKRSIAAMKAEKNLQKMQNNKEFQDTISKIRILTAQIGKAKAFEEDAKQIKALEKELSKQRSIQEKILKENNLSIDDISANYECKKCNDTGRINGKFCDCYKKEFFELMFENIGSKQELASFDKFDENIATGSHKESLLKLKDIMQKFVENYPNCKSHTLLFSGKTGVGKTYLAECIASGLIKKGAITLFTSAFAMNNNFLKYHTTFDQNKQVYYDALVEPDVLIIDDLGTEPILKNVTINYLCAILNERFESKKVTIITTNLSPEQILERYGNRIFSRIANKADSIMCFIDGDDLRLKTKK